MVFALPGAVSGERLRATPAQTLSRFLSRANPGAGAAFMCGVRVARGDVNGEGWRWRYRTSHVEATRTEDVTVLHHGSDVVLLLRVNHDPRRNRLRPGFVRLTAVEAGTGAQIRLSCRPEMVSRLTGRISSST